MQGLDWLVEGYSISGMIEFLKTYEYFPDICMGALTDTRELLLVLELAPVKEIEAILRELKRYIPKK